MLTIWTGSTTMFILENLKYKKEKQASEKLVKLGYTNIIEIGGINSWPGETVTGDK